MMLRGDANRLQTVWSHVTAREIGCPLPECNFVLDDVTIAQLTGSDALALLTKKRAADAARSAATPPCTVPDCP